MILAAAVLSLALVAGGVATMTTAFDRHAAETVLEQIYTGKPSSAQQREQVRLVFRSSSDGGLVAQAGVIAMEEADLAGIKTPNGQVWLFRAVTDLRRGLSTSPADGFAWQRLAGAWYLMGVRGEATTQALRMALYTTRNSQGAPPLQMALLAALWNRLDPELQTMGRSAIARNWAEKASRPSLVPFTAQPWAQDLLRSVTGGGPDFEAWLANALETRRKAEILRERAAGAGLRR